MAASVILPPMKIHEYQARELLEQAGVSVPPAVVVESGDEAAKAFEQLGAELAVVKAQVHAGGRGKGGGVKLVRSADEARDAAATILSKPLVTPQTGPEGVPVNKLLVASGVDIEKEYYVGLAIDRARGVPVLMASSEGGVEIEEVAAKNPDAIVKQPVDPKDGLSEAEAVKVAEALGFQGDAKPQAAEVMQKLARLFLDVDASIAEINPLVLTPGSDQHPDGQVLAIDAKINIDDNALFRQKQAAEYHDPTEEDPAEVVAKEHNLSYIALDGNIGCLVNGAGLAMATMDIIKLHGGEPANFLDVGGSATQEAVTEAFRIILGDEKVKGILVNIFGGIAKCDTIANAIIAAAKDVGFEVPLVVRLEGTNVEPARKILADAAGDLPTMQIGTDLTDAAEKVTQAVGVAA